MPEQLGGLDVAVDALTIGVRHRKDLGDLDALAASIEKLGLLQPITITPGRVLVCGWRRLEAVKRLGWTQVRAWVRSGLSDDATRVLAEHDENFLRQAYTRTEQATLYSELKAVLKEEAQRRQEASRFGAVADDGSDVGLGGEVAAGETDDSNILGGVDSTPPGQSGKTGKAREQAAILATGKKSWQALERIGKLMDLSVDPDQPEQIRELAAEAILRIEDGGQVAPEWEAVQAALRAHGGATPTDDDASAAGAARDVADEPTGGAQCPRISLYALRVWATTWDGIADLLDKYDPAVLGPALPPPDWATICEIQQRLTAFVAQLRAAREGGAADPQEADHGTDAANQAAHEPVDDANHGGDQGAGADRALAEVIPLGVRS